MTDGYDLDEFGWDGLVIPKNLANICSYLPKWNQMKYLREPQLAGSHTGSFPHTYFHDCSGNVYMPALEKCELHNSGGGYSDIYKANRAIYRPSSDKYGEVRLNKTEDFKEICIKEIVVHIDPDKDTPSEYIEEINAILYEAYLHALIYKTLEKEGLLTCVPRLHEVVATTLTDAPAKSPEDIESIWMTMEFMEGNTLEKFLRKQLDISNPVGNTALLKEILIQLAFILHTLQSKLLFNHRDLKINNVYIRHHKDAWERTMGIPGRKAMTFKTDVVLIDFGFSCIACGSGFTNPRRTLLGAGSYFKQDDECMKAGRDLAQFLYSLHCSYPLQNYVTSAFFEAIHAAVQVERGDRRFDLFMGVDAAGTPIIHPRLPRSLKYNNGIYKFLRDNRVEIPGCAPLKFIESILAI